MRCCDREEMSIHTTTATRFKQSRRQATLLGLRIKEPSPVGQGETAHAMQAMRHTASEGLAGESHTGIWEEEEAAAEKKSGTLINFILISDHSFFEGERILRVTLEVLGRTCAIMYIINNWHQYHVMSHLSNLYLPCLFITIGS